MPPRRKKKKGAEPASRGLAAGELAARESPAEVQKLERAIESDGGSILGVYRDPLGARWQVLAGLPIDKVAPTPFQRDVSPAHVARLAAVIDRLDRFLDPIIPVRGPDGSYFRRNDLENARVRAQLQGGFREDGTSRAGRRSAGGVKS